jgi:glutathione S-transferase
MIINELLDELHPEPALFPRDPVARAEARGWIVYGNDVVMPAGGAAMLAIAGGARGDSLAKPLGTLRDVLGKLQLKLDHGGPYFLGGAFSLVDASYAPFFRRWRLAEGWGAAAGAHLLADFPRVRAWVEAMLARPSVTAAEPAELDAKSRRFYEERAARSRPA